MGDLTFVCGSTSKALPKVPSLTQKAHEEEYNTYLLLNWIWCSSLSDNKRLAFILPLALIIANAYRLLISNCDKKAQKAQLIGYRYFI